MTATTTSPAPPLVNGIGIDALGKTIDAIRQSAALGAFQFRARNRCLGGDHNPARCRGYRSPCPRRRSP